MSYANRWAVLFFTSLLAFVLLSWLVVHGHTVHFNQSIYRWISQGINPLLTRFMSVITNLGDWYTYVGLSAMLLLLPATRMNLGWPLGWILLITEVSNFGLKKSFALNRPDSGQWLVNVLGYGYPSGHAMHAVAYMGLFVFLMVPCLYKKSYRVTTLVAAMFFILLVGISRIYLGVHYVTDVIGGYLAGMVVLSGFVSIGLIIKNKRTL